MQEENPFGRRKINTLTSAECELSVDHITITLAIQWRRLGAGMQCLASAVPQLQHERILANKGFSNLAIVTKFSPLPEQNEDLRFCLP